MLNILFNEKEYLLHGQAKLIKYVTSLKKFARSQSSRNGATGSSFRSSFQEEAWKRYNRRMQEEYEEEMERVVSFSLCFLF